MKVDAKKLSKYIKKEEVVFQRYGELVEVSNDVNLENRDSLIHDMDVTSSIEVYKKNDCVIIDDFNDLNDWATTDDVLLLLQIVGTLICIPSKEIAQKGILID